jgi:hypothetical protein
MLKLTALLPASPTVTTTFPVVAPAGTLTTINVFVQFTTAADVPLNVTAPRVEPKFVPVIFTVRPGTPAVGDSAAMTGGPGGVEIDVCGELPPQAESTSKRQMGTNHATTVAPEQAGVKGIRMNRFS